MSMTLARADVAAVEVNLAGLGIVPNTQRAGQRLSVPVVEFTQ